MATRAIVYISVGNDFIKETRRSIESVNGQFPVVVCTNHPGDFDCDTFKLPDRQYKYWFLDRCNYFNLILNELPYEQILFLDSDTYICDDLTDIFDVLKKFDIAGTQAIGRQTLQRDDIPASFPELHCGMLAVNNNWMVKSLFKMWFDIYKEKPGYYGNDQPAMREALWYNPDIKLGILPFEYCFRFRWGGLVSCPVKILHGKEYRISYERIARRIAQDQGIRVYTRRQLA